ncbi:hypothetical protein CWI38_1567p0010 [Hamiltosporidium tvaerminnensis]|uniref:Uncharacterized protein n=1 Tax=Hamiltosporidium tvaerminnensis TaxID=1176355 RepID=A0A4Q9LQE7_9MICR|nr:hypothetical protein CWI38_1567p0010 [Hamiltosporidium tvaerminnensis]
MYFYPVPQMCYYNAALLCNNPEFGIAGYILLNKTQPTNIIPVSAVQYNTGLTNIAYNYAYKSDFSRKLLARNNKFKHIASRLEYEVVNAYDACICKTNQYAVFEILQRVCSKDEIYELEYFFPLLENDYDIFLKDIICHINDVFDLTENIKLSVNKLFHSRKLKGNISSELLERFKNNIMILFKTRGMPMIYLKPIFLILPIWIKNTLCNDSNLVNNVLYIPWCLKVIKAIMEYNYDVLKPFIFVDYEGNGQNEFSYIFLKNQSNISYSFSLISRMLKNICITLGKESIYTIFESISKVDFLYSHYDRVFSPEYICSGMPGMLFDVFVLLPTESMIFLASMVSNHDSLKQKPGNKDIDIKRYIRAQITVESYKRNKSIQHLFNDLTLTYKRILCDEITLNYFAKDRRISNNNFKKWILENINNLEKMISYDKLPKYVNYIQFIKTSNLFLHYVSKVFMNPGLTSRRFKDIITRKMIWRLNYFYFKQTSAWI